MYEAHHAVIFKTAQLSYLNSTVEGKFGGQWIIYTPAVELCSCVTNSNVCTVHCTDVYKIVNLTRYDQQSVFNRSGVYDRVQRLPLIITHHTDLYTPSALL